MGLSFLCPECKGHAVHSSTNRCCKLAYKREIYKRNKESILKQQRQHYQYAPNRETKQARERKTSKEARTRKHSQYLEAERKRRIRLRREVFEHYGLGCACCGESNEAFLTIDHVDGGGNIHRKQIGNGSTALYKYLRRHWPTGFRTLCHNCNFGYARYGICPHLADPLVG